MTQDEIIRMAQTCGFSREDHHAIYGMLARFAELVAAAEREECAQLCEAKKPKYRWAQCSQYQAGQYEMAEYLVEAIRARNAA